MIEKEENDFFFVLIIKIGAILKVESVKKLIL